MDITILIIIGSVFILAGLLWRFRIRKSKENDKDFDRQHESKEAEK